MRHLERGKIEYPSEPLTRDLTNTVLRAAESNMDAIVVLGPPPALLSTSRRVKDFSKQPNARKKIGRRDMKP